MDSTQSEHHQIHKRFISQELGAQPTLLNQTNKMDCSWKTYTMCNSAYQVKKKTPADTHVADIKGRFNSPDDDKPENANYGQ